MNWTEASYRTSFRKYLSVRGFCIFFKTFNPQKVKNIDTFCPVAAAPLASTKVAKALSKSSLKELKFSPSACCRKRRRQAQASSPFQAIPCSVLFLPFLYQLVARSGTPGRSVTCESGIGRHNFHPLARSDAVHGFLYLYDRAGTLQAAGINPQRFLAEPLCADCDGADAAG